MKIRGWHYPMVVVPWFPKDLSIFPLDGSNGFSHANRHVHRTLRQILLRFSFAPRAVTPVTDITERAMAVTRPIFPTHRARPKAETSGVWWMKRLLVLLGIMWFFVSFLCVFCAFCFVCFGFYDVSFCFVKHFLFVIVQNYSCEDLYGLTRFSRVFECSVIYDEKCRFLQLLYTLHVLCRFVDVLS